MKAYELLVILDASLDEEARAATMERIQSTITNDGGAIDSVDDWGKRRLAYEIDHRTEGDYSLIDFHTEPSAIAELNRVLGITDAVVRSMVVQRTDRD